MPQQQIEYAPVLPSQKCRRVFRRIALGVVAVLVLLLAIKSAPRAWQRIQVLYWQHQAMTYTAPADRVVYDDHPADAANLHKANPSLITDAHGEVFDFAKPWDRFYRLISPPGRRLAATLFLHEMQNAEGETRLVVVEAYSSTNDQGQTSIRHYAVFRSTVFRPGDAFHPPQEELDRSPERVFLGITKWFAGQVDPKNPAHFTIQGVWNGIPVNLDGWLRENDQVRLDAPLWPPTSPAPPSSASPQTSAR